ncbi:MAG: aminopeptidase N [Gammaproteobacteria bacterium]|nr:aminopeptidase N [Gammaproteobacteria bacterium]MDX5375551.1 aminopeptidase N [Gammaproteobacteria bacterium]
MKQANPQTVYLKDYQPPAYWVDRVELRFELGEEQARVHSRLALRRREGVADDAPLVLDGEDLALKALALDGEVLAADRYRVDETSLVVEAVPAVFTLEVETVLRPQDNTRLEGLYRSGGLFCTQCEAEGFRRITYFPDRPDVMACYTTTLVADPSACPVLLSNGNCIDSGVLDDGRHYATWEDPYPKPSYLFALVAGQLDYVEGRHVTASGRDVTLRVYVEPHNIDKCDHALASLKKAMAWDEQRFGLEYDLDIYMIVAVDDFNMGAMENKGLNIFNSKYVLARPDTATDADYVAIEAVIAHEYFHNWTGNRVTCRDWFQLSLKEGLTVFRDQEFTADMHSAAVKRIDDVRMLRTHQFAEDAGPMAHPVRPDAYIEINNFYTVTVYEKGAEVVRLYQTLLGREGFRRGMDLYFDRHDGQAVTTDDFRAAMADANGADLAQFQRWYDQAGTPVVRAEGRWLPDEQVFELRLAQSCPPTPGQSEKRPFLIPVAVGLLGADGRDLPLVLEGETGEGETTRVLRLTRAEQVFRFTGITEAPVPSLLRGFSAPVNLEFEQTPEALMFLMAHDTDSFNRWEAGQRLALNAIECLLEEYGHQHALGLEPAFIDAFRAVLLDEAADPALIAEALALPSEAYLAERFTPADPEAIHAVRRFVRRTLAATLRDVFQDTYDALKNDGPYSAEAAAIGRRALKNLCLSYLAELDDADIHEQSYAQFARADNMSDQLAALRALADSESEEGERALAEFEARWRDDPLVLDKWFGIQAMSRRPDTLARVRQLMGHPGFSMRNPNRVRALIGAFTSGNPLRFHAADGSGYDFLAERVLELDALNPQVAARLVKPLTRWRHYEPGRSARMRAALQRVGEREGLSRDVYEIVSRGLAD